MLHRALRTLREFHRMSQTALASELGISKSYLCEIEGSTKNASIDILDRYAEIFKIPVSSILLFSEEIDSDKPTSRIKFRAANKVLNVLEWIAQSGEVRSAK